ncbi:MULTISPECIES: DUF2231 domain-containing protein [unclassified Serratia (in: enterobacteria)]|uniref:DUF2231 domain-containing protein n=1 Tax=unclassified Serratia (in: enterobacteria) TaxID=2647522 RepID=UPI002ED08ADF|nr:DUF2231 domain-containing protein [Serratia sp. C2(2)]MEE4446552.1 DUF2231 domain-containing protein [Serratia sp. C2(1)]
MKTHANSKRSAFAVGLYELLEPIPLGFFVAAWIFDIIYLNSFVLMWTHAASWLIAIGLVIAVIPRLMNLVQVWVGQHYPQSSPVKIHFWLNLLAILLAILNAFIHSRDAYAVVPMGVILSTLVVILLLLSNVQLALRQRTVKEQPL